MIHALQRLNDTRTVKKYGSNNGDALPDKRKIGFSSDAASVWTLSLNPYSRTTNESADINLGTATTTTPPSPPNNTYNNHCIHARVHIVNGTRHTGHTHASSGSFHLAHKIRFDAENISSIHLLFECNLIRYGTSCECSSLDTLHATDTYIQRINNKEKKMPKSKQETNFDELAIFSRLSDEMIRQIYGYTVFQWMRWTESA